MIYYHLTKIGQTLRILFRKTGNWGDICHILCISESSQCSSSDMSKDVISCLDCPT